MFRHTRREALSAIGTVGLWTTLGSGLALGSTTEFTRTESPIQKSIYDVTQSREGPYMVAANGDVLARRATTDSDDTDYEQVLDAGLRAGDKTFYGTDSTADGRNVWLAGESGRVGYYDAVDEQFVDYSNPNGRSTTWRDVVVGEAAGDDRVYLFGSGGEVIVGTRDGPGMDWTDAVVFNGGNTIYGAALVEENEGYCCDSTGSVYETVDGGSTWSEIGIDDVSVPLYDVAASARDAVTAVGSDGVVYEYDGGSWTEYTPGSSAIRGVDRTTDHQVAVGAGGVVYTRTSSGWSATDLDSSKTLRGVALDTTGDYPDSVGGNSGRILERGGYSAYPDELRLDVADGRSLDYAFEVSGPTTGTNRNEPDDDVTETTTGFTVDGTLRGGDSVDNFLRDGDSTDRYRYGGNVSGLAVTDGSVADLTTVRSGTEVSVERLTDRTWERVSTPVDVTLYEIVETSDGFYAAGESGRMVRTGSDGTWRIVTKTGVRGGGNTLYGAGVTDDRAAVWVAGGSGVVGRIDPATEEVTDYSKPNVYTTTWTDVAVAGSAGAESVYLVNGSGEVVTGEYDDGTLTLNDPVKPGNGSSIRGVTTIDESVAYVCDGNSTVYETRDGGASWTDIGVDWAGVTLYDVAAVARDDITVVGGSGRLFRYNGAVWTLTKLGGNSRVAVDRLADRGVAVGGSTELFEREIEGWTETYDGRSDVTLYSTIVVRTDGGTGKYAVGGNGTALRQTFDDPL
ncbi:hypothetical protein NDI56_05325 [Haloarcula sp. S1CR25-12]|uniref:Uncharacterized protein n=1 Tax=Haloarcula saliterrae TaxID=2950534 RepID=A0ABU2FA62_9EURY|nr:hypothetical protein [Haloarcula sp. S1CR25-12]MDS0258813.1 hypothetical protein [Haloarcula sp. S1CR25-12]